MSKPEDEASDLERAEIHPTSYAWRHPVNEEEQELSDWFRRLTVDDKLELYGYWHRAVKAHRKHRE